MVEAGVRVRGLRRDPPLRQGVVRNIAAALRALLVLPIVTPAEVAVVDEEMRGLKLLAQYHRDCPEAPTRHQPSA